MELIQTKISGAWVAELSKAGDDRGFFARAWCKEAFVAHGITNKLSQANLSMSRAAGTIRGMHFQREPHAEMKAVRCIRGAIFDVVVDLRPESATYCQWHGEKLTAENRRMPIVPEGCAHGFQTIEDNSEVFYLVSSPYSPESEGGVRWDDKEFNISWPLPLTDISAKDANYKDFKK